MSKPASVWSWSPAEVDEPVWPPRGRMRNIRHVPLARNVPVVLPPHSLEAEQAVLGGLMIDNDAWERVADQVSDGDFYRHDHRLIFRAIHVLAERNMPFDVVTLSEQLDKEGHLSQVGGLAYLGELAKNIPSVANIKAYAAIIRERATLRKLVSISSEIADSAYSPQGRTGEEILDEAERKIFE